MKTTRAHSTLKRLGYFIRWFFNSSPTALLDVDLVPARSAPSVRGAEWTRCGAAGVDRRRAQEFQRVGTHGRREMS